MRSHQNSAQAVSRPTKRPFKMRSNSSASDGPTSCPNRKARRLPGVITMAERRGGSDIGLTTKTVRRVRDNQRRMKMGSSLVTEKVSNPGGEEAVLHAQQESSGYVRKRAVLNRANLCSIKARM